MRRLKINYVQFAANKFVKEESSHTLFLTSELTDLKAYN